MSRNTRPSGQPDSLGCENFRRSNRLLSRRSLLQAAMLGTLGLTTADWLRFWQWNGVSLGCGY